MRIKKPLIRQAGSAEAFVGSAATGREHVYCTVIVQTSLGLQFPPIKPSDLFRPTKSRITSFNMIINEIYWHTPMACRDKAQVEIVTMDYFRELGYEYVHGPMIAPDGEAPERADYGQGVRLRRLRDAMPPRPPGGEMELSAAETIVGDVA